MENINGIFDALYLRLILRDFFGKVVPGTIVIFSICVVTFSPDEILKFIDGIKFFPAIILIGFTWIVAFALQAMGEITKLIRYHTYNTHKEFYAQLHEFKIKTDIQEHQQLERLIVIKEACGNGYVALVLSGVLLCLHYFTEHGLQAMVEGFKLHWPVIVFVGILTAFLAAMHFIHVRRQDEYMQAILEACKVSSGE